MIKDDSSNAPICIVVPFEKQPALASRFLTSLAACREELKDLRCTLVLIDSANEADSRSRTEELFGDRPYVHLQNEKYTGFVRAANLGLKLAVNRGADVVLLHPESIVSPGAFREMQRVAYLDSMVGFVSPRSNGAAIGSFSQQQEFHNAQHADALAIFNELSPHLPVFHYVPAANEKCMLIKLDVLREFGLLDDAYETDRDANNDLVMRANRCGYRAALANHAFVYYSGPGSPSKSEHQSAALLTSRYPEYEQHRNAYFRSAHHQGEVLLAGLLKDDRGRYDVVFDFSSFGTYHNGTFAAAKQILIHAAAGWESTFQISVLVEDEAARYHELHRLPGIILVPLNTTKVFAVAFRFGQPFDYEAIIRMSRLAVCNVYSMLDPIAWDCLYLHKDEVDETWRAVFSYADAVMYLSNFVAKQFHSRFQRRAGTKELVSYPSIDTRDYRNRDDLSSSGEYLLVIGNAFAHKNVRQTVEILSREFENGKIVALGLEESTFRNVVAYESGHLEEDGLHELFLNARAVIFPSFYEGFGLPILRSLSYRKPVLARSTQVNRELFEKLGKPDDLILYDCTDGLVSRLRREWPAWKGSAASQAVRHDWTDSAEEIGEFLRGLINNVSYAEVLIPRLNYMNLLRRTSESRFQAQSATESLRQSDAQIQRLEKQVSELRIAVRDRELQIRNLLSSLSWAVTAPMRSLGRVWSRTFRDKSPERSA
jgi:GT2 family glycosyltransferase